LAPLFRSDQQLRILGQLFVTSDRPRSIAELASATSIPHSTVAREVKRLVEHDVLRSTRRGTAAFIEPNWSLPWAIDLARLLAKTIGPLGVLAEELRGHRPQIEEAMVYGSWAERFEGTPGPFPRDVDVLVVGTLTLAESFNVARRVEQRLGGAVEVNATVVSSDGWAHRSTDPFLGTIANRPLVSIPDVP
jgi:hypothetical protein